MAALSRFLVDGHPRIVAVVQKQNSVKIPRKRRLGPVATVLQLFVTVGQAPGTANGNIFLLHCLTQFRLEITAAVLRPRTRQRVLSITPSKEVGAFS